MDYTNPDDLLKVLMQHIKEGNIALNSELPTYGIEPEDKDGIWSWGSKLLMVGSCVEDIKLIDRGEFFGYVYHIDEDRNVEKLINDNLPPNLYILCNSLEEVEFELTWF